MSAPMGFTKAQRLKGLKKQLRNLGYEAVRSGSSGDLGPETVPVGENDRSEDLERGAHTIASWKAQMDAW